MKNIITILLFFVTFCSCKQNQIHTTPIPSNNIHEGISYINDAFDDVDIVAIGEYHGIVEVTDFYVQLVGDWTSVKRFFKEVRNVNLKSEHKIRILAAEPPIDWSKINSLEDYYVFLGQRDQFYAEVVIQEVLNKKKKALLIMGSSHFNKLKTHKMNPDNPITTLLKVSNKNLRLINTMTMNDFPYDLLPSINKGDIIETTNPILGNLKVGPPFIKKRPLKDQTDALLYLGDLKDIQYEVKAPFNDELYEAELKKRKDLIKLE